jgi:hypothetical protein
MDEKPANGCITSEKAVTRSFDWLDDALINREELHAGTFAGEFMGTPVLILL